MKLTFSSLNSPISDLSHGGYQELDDIDSPSYNIIPTNDPFKLFPNEKRLEPFFDPNVNQNVTALVGKSAYLNCIVNNLGNKTVEWIRFMVFSENLHCSAINRKFNLQSRLGCNSISTNPENSSTRWTIDLLGCEIIFVSQLNVFRFSHQKCLIENLCFRLIRFCTDGTFNSFVF